MDRQSQAGRAGAELERDVPGLHRRPSRGAVNTSKKRDHRMWLRWAMSGACGPSMHRLRQWPPEACAGAMIVDKPGPLRWLAECARSWSKKDLKTARPGDSWPVYAHASGIDLLAACRRQAIAHGTRFPGVCSTCGGSGQEPAPSWAWESRPCAPCWSSGQTIGPEYDRMLAFFQPHGRDWPWRPRV